MAKLSVRFHIHDHATQKGFVQTHEIWTKDNPKHQIKYHSSQLTDSLVCVSMSNEIRRTIASLTQSSKDISNQTRAANRGPLLLTGTTKIFGKSLTQGSYLKSMSQPATRQFKRHDRNYLCTSAPAKQDPGELDLRLSPVNFRKRYEEEEAVAVNDTSNLVVPVKKEHDFRLPYRECLTKNKSPAVHILEVECLICGQLGSIYRHRADKANCGRCGNSLAMKLDNKLEYQFKITKQVSEQEVLDKMRKHNDRAMRRLL
ncbi:uncharacterized protein LOC134816889 isoform X2 [Bolinopsis microptera]|uniref:uncharacterized protein LOC134816889 isoform X2 n=1 Tax=Bolinopsis microptera TaxID=2820187 RepID=UPI0030797F92